MGSIPVVRRQRGIDAGQELAELYPSRRSVERAEHRRDVAMALPVEECARNPPIRLDATGFSCYCGGNGMKHQIYESAHCRAFLTDERSESSRGQQVLLLVEYDATSPVNASETVVYSDDDLLPSGMTGAEFKGIMARRRQRD